MNGKLSNIGKWVFGLLALITVGLAIYFYLGLTDESRTNLFLNWGYILIILGIVIALISVIFTAAVKGVNGKTLLIAIIAFAIIAVVAYLMSKGSFNVPYQAGELTYSKVKHFIMARKTPEINSSSQADIAFLLLCFFLMTTSMDVDYGITRRLPPPVEQNDEDVKVKERNVMNVMVNKSDRLLVNGRPSDISMLKDLAKEFMTPRPGDETAPEVETKTFNEGIGDILVSKGVISLQNDRGTSYAMYISVQNELARAFNEMKEELAQKTWHKSLDQLSEDQTKALNEAVPVRVSEAEPVDYKK